MSIFGNKISSQATIEVPIMARMWREDGVWNVSAFDVPIVAYGDDLDEARANFEEAVTCHFQTLEHFNKLNETVNTLRALAAERGFYEDRVLPREVVEKFIFPSNFPLELCATAH